MQSVITSYLPYQFILRYDTKQHSQQVESYKSRTPHTCRSHHRSRSWARCTQMDEYRYSGNCLCQRIKGHRPRACSRAGGREHRHIFWSVLIGIALKMKASEQTISVVREFSDVITLIVKWIIQAQHSFWVSSPPWELVAHRAWPAVRCCWSPWPAHSSISAMT